MISVCTPEQSEKLQELYTLTKGVVPNRRLLGQAAKRLGMKPIKIKMWFAEETERRQHSSLPASTEDLLGLDSSASYSSYSSLDELISLPLPPRAEGESPDNCICHEIYEHVNKLELIVDGLERRLHNCAMAIENIKESLIRQSNIKSKH